MKDKWSFEELGSLSVDISLVMMDIHHVLGVAGKQIIFLMNMNV